MCTLKVRSKLEITNHLDNLANYRRETSPLKMKMITQSMKITTIILNQLKQRHKKFKAKQVETFN